ncbi:MAG: hypothetical protein Q4E54_06020 [Lachnospiraceae bacterium]|nr:hypothetical protein [Lachnospiraceae bacterium]
MAYIPEKHLKFDLLPYCRENGGEVFSYPCSLIDELGRYLPEGYTMMPYGYKSYEEYYAQMDQYAEKYFQDAVVSDSYKRFKEEMHNMNVKENWSVLRYVGESDNNLFGLTHGRTYYWPCCLDNPVYEGVIDDEEFTSYLYSTEAADWEILDDPTGMAYKTIRKVTMRM